MFEVLVGSADQIGRVEREGLIYIDAARRLDIVSLSRCEDVLHHLACQPVSAITTCLVV